MKNNTHVEPTKATLGEWLEEWLEMRRPDLSPTTGDNYRTMLDAYVYDRGTSPNLGEVKIQALDARDLDRFYRGLSAKGGRGGKALGPKSVRNVHLLLHAALLSARKKGLITRNPADDVEAVPEVDRRARVRKMRAETWSVEELRTFLAHVRADRLYAFYLLAATTGLRRGELVGLPWSAVDLDAGSIEIGQTLVVLRSGPTLKDDPKSDASAARIGLDEATAGALRDFRKRQLEERMAAGELWTDTGLVFTDEIGRALHPATCLARFQREAKAAGLRPCRLHSLRHTYASLLLEDGVPLEAISKRLRHSDISTTMALYAHLTEKLDRQVAEGGASYILGGQR